MLFAGSVRLVGKVPSGGQPGYGPYGQPDADPPPPWQPEPAARPGHAAPSTEPWSTDPRASVPRSTDPWSTEPRATESSGADARATDPWTAYDATPRHAAPPPPPLFPAPTPSWQPRIVPSPPPQRGRFLRGLMIGLLAGLIAFGVAGYAVGRWTGDPSSAPPATGSPGQDGSSSLPPYERSQRALNQPKFAGDLAAFAEPWLPWVSGCLTNADPDGPALNPGEATRVICEFGSMTVYFVAYKSTGDRDRARARNLTQNADARRLTTGVASGEELKAVPSGRTEGSYIEYAYRTGTDAASRTVCGLWWDDAGKQVAAYLLAFWKEGIGESWEPMRDVWRRYA